LTSERSILQRLADGEPVLTVGVRAARTPDIARLAYAAGYRVLWVDLEHSSMPVDVAAQIAATAHDLGMEAWVRVAERDYGIVGRLLDGGATGIIMPRVESADAAQQLVTMARFPPRGQRSQIGTLPHFGSARPSPAPFMERIDRATSVHVLIESAAGVANVEAIAAVEGVDVLHVGLNDLSVDLGCVGNLRHPDVSAACARVTSAAARHGKLAAVGGVADPEHYRELTALGAVPLIFAAVDSEIIAAGLRQRAVDWLAHVAPPVEAR
jgi:2-keto-3-deoxy-L-rhamnonate aldolase RhmA